ncbi:MAG: rRNA pseudouridine synthase [Clostridia bacterium]|nr:rRNA pseudouridine synthase [Clostridia bacterium]
MRLDKFFSESSVLSRSECKKAVKKGEITVNGETVKNADLKIDENKDEIAYKGEKITYSRYTYIMLNKPSGVVSATEDGRDKTVIDLLPENYRNRGLFPCGRLDKDTLGLIILTNDGISAHNALSPKKHFEKTYYFKTADGFSDGDAKKIEGGLLLADGYTTKPCRIERISDREGNIILTEGKYHEIKRLFAAVGNKIVYLERIKFGDIALGDLPRGDWRTLSDEETAAFIDKNRR